MDIIFTMAGEVVVRDALLSEDRSIDTDSAAYHCAVGTLLCLHLVWSWIPPPQISPMFSFALIFGRDGMTGYLTEAYLRVFDPLLHS